MIRCASCGASNPEAAEWCGQCYEALQNEPEVPDAASGTEPEPSQESGHVTERPLAETMPVSSSPWDVVADTSTDGDPGEPPASTGDVPPDGPVRDGYRRRGGELEWSCHLCETWNSINTLLCTTCGTSLGDRYAAEEPAVSRDWPRAKLLSAVGPGLGHISVGRPFAGAARFGLFSLWLALGVWMIVDAGRVALLSALPLVGGALALYGLSLVDIERLSESRTELMTPRVLLWLVVGVTGGVLVMGLPAFLGASG